MNFLSHFYFDRHSSNSNRITGTVLPDLVKNARKEWSLHPEKNYQFYTDNALSDFFSGWKRHLEVDKYFHSSGFFKEHTNNIRTAIVPVLTDSPARPSFIAHIALELMLDSLLLTEKILDASDFYSHLHAANRKSLNQFLELNKITDTQLFFNFFDEFIEAEYLNNYREASNIMFALNRICMRLWDSPFNETQKLQLTAILIDYQEELKEVFISVFHQIDGLLN